MSALPRTVTMFPGAEPAELDGLVLRVKCAQCGAVAVKTLTESEAEDVRRLYENGGFHPGGYVQDIFPDWQPWEWELFLQSHICGACWDDLFGVERPENDIKGVEV